MGVRGSKNLSDRAWLLGARPRRLLLHALLVEPTPDAGWSPESLAARCEVGERGLDRHLARLRDLGLVRREGRRNWAPADPGSSLSAALAELLRALDGVSDRRDE